MKLSFLKKNVIITGGTRGIGSSLSKNFLKLGANVFATGTDQLKIKKLNQLNINRRLLYLHLDLLSSSSINNFQKFIIKQKKIDILINNAGINIKNPIDKIKMSDWDKIQTINLKGPALLTKIISKKMKKNKYGRIVNISSIWSVVGKEMRAVYASSKSGLVGLTTSSALDLAKYNILVNSVSPGVINTELTKSILGKKGIREITKQIPLNRLGKANEVADLVVFLSSEVNSYITGQNIIIDGGYTSA